MRIRAGGVPAFLSAVAILAIPLTLEAADHRDGAAVKMDPSTDINDVFAWMSADGATVYLAMTVFPLATSGAKFSNTAKYVFHLDSSAGYGMPPTNVNVICTFDANQKASCWAVNGSTALDYVTGDASATEGFASMSGKLKVFAGLRDDPFFFNLEGFQQTAAAVGMAASGLQFDPAGCPTLDAATDTALLGLLTHTNMGMSPPKDFFSGKNTLAIVVAVDKAMVTPGGKILGVWASTNQ
jgi:hypothetical protein